VLEALRILLKSEGYQTEGVTSLAGKSRLFITRIRGILWSWSARC
jgi:hypothetical protein